MFKLFLGLFFCPFIIQAKVIQIVSRQWQQEDLFCNTVSFGYRTKYFGDITKVKSYPTQFKKGFNPTNHKTITIDYIPFDFFHLKMIVQGEFDYSTYRLPGPDYLTSSTGPSYETKVRKILVGSGLYYDLPLSIKRWKKKKMKTTKNLHLLPGIMIQRYLHHTASHHLNGALEVFENSLSRSGEKYLIRDELRIMVYPYKKLALWVSIANFITKNWYNPTKILLRDVPFSGYGSIGVNISYQFH
jgi:hypothetical protein